MLLLESSGAHIILPCRKCDASVNVPRARKAKIHPAGSHLTILLLAGFDLKRKIEMQGALSARLARLRPRAVLILEMTIFNIFPTQMNSLNGRPIICRLFRQRFMTCGFNKSTIVICSPISFRKGFVSI